MTTTAVRLPLSTVVPTKQGLWLGHKSSFLYFPMPQGEVWLRQSTENLTWLFRHRSEAKSFYRRLQTYAARLHRLFFFKLRMKGLGYRVRRLSKYLYRFYFTKTNYIYLHLPQNIYIYLRKRRMFLVSRDKGLLHHFVKQILALHRPSPYNRRGFVFPRYLRRRKPGKKVI